MDTIRFSLAAAPPFRLDLTVWVLRRRPANSIDSWDGKTYRRVLLVDGQSVLIEVEQAGPLETPRLSIVAHADDFTSRTKRQVREAIERNLGLRRNMAEFYSMVSGDSALAPLVNRFIGVRPPRYSTLFESIANGIIGQQLSLYAAINILNRFAAAFGKSMHASDVTVLGFPEAADIAGLTIEELKKPGLTANKAVALSDAAQLIANGDLNIGEFESMDNQAAFDRLTGLRGIGTWTADYILLRGLGRLDVFPRKDSGALKSLRKWMNVDETAFSRWRPYQGLVYFHLLLRGLAEEGRIR